MSEINLRDGISIENGIKHRCPKCQTVVSIGNDDSVIFKNATIIHLYKESWRGEVKCKRCKNILQINP